VPSSTAVQGSIHYVADGPWACAPGACCSGHGCPRVGGWPPAAADGRFPRFWQGNNDAMFWLWKNYQTGCGVEPDFAVAIQWLGKAAKHGSITAQTTVESLKKINDILMEQQKAEYNAIVEDIKRLAKIDGNDQK